MESWIEFFKVASERRRFQVRIDETILYVSKFELAGLSDFFEAALFGGLHNEFENALVLESKDVDEMAQLFAVAFAIYGRKPMSVSVENFSAVWRLADEYMMEVSN